MTNTATLVASSLLSILALFTVGLAEGPFLSAQAVSETPGNPTSSPFPSQVLYDSLVANPLDDDDMGVHLSPAPTVRMSTPGNPGDGSELVGKTTAVIDSARQIEYLVYQTYVAALAARDKVPHKFSVALGPGFKPKVAVIAVALTDSVEVSVQCFKAPERSRALEVGVYCFGVKPDLPVIAIAAEIFKTEGMTATTGDLERFTAPLVVSALRHAEAIR